jgi:hypothetical protein
MNHGLQPLLRSYAAPRLGRNQPRLWSKSAALRAKSLAISFLSDACPPTLGFHSEVWITLWKTDGPDHISPRKTDVL